MNPLYPLEIFIINYSKYYFQSVKENRNVIPFATTKIKVKPLVDTGVKKKPWYAIYYSNTCMRKKFDQCLSAPYRRKHSFPVW